MFRDIKIEMDTPTIHRIISYAAFDGSPEGTRREAEKYQDSGSLCFYGWIENGEVAGICGFEEHAAKVEIHLISVDEPYRGKGIGGAMVAELQNKYHKPIEAETNDDAVDFYRKRGFTATSFTHPLHGKRWACVLKELKIISIRHKHTVAWLIGAGRGWIMLDALWPDSFPIIRDALRENGIRFEDIPYLAVTHFHMDHAGAVETLKEHGLTLLLHEAQTAGPEAMNRFFIRKPDLAYRPIGASGTRIVSSADSRALLSDMGLTGGIIHTPGHSEDSVSLVLDGECAFTGDLPRSDVADGYGDASVVGRWRRLLGYGVKR
ncbi:MAG: GNAT family N-acetyltransferase, partial [Peptococcaceae bacterium]|nr:GNAT family N-acetyltransferase [Peptococcaceae bacterium]